MTIEQARPTRSNSGTPELRHAELVNASRTKRVLEFMAALSGVMLLLPLMLFVAAAIKLDSRGPVLYKQARAGLNGRVFSIFKFRTMTQNASEAGFRQAEREDARVTRVGKVLRRINLDEIPQLLNVLVGDMALIGPRPHPVALDDSFVSTIPGYMARYSVKPGITGWAQIHGYRGETRTVEQMQARVQHDLQYIENWSLWLDLRIAFRTVFSWRAYQNAF